MMHENEGQARQAEAQAIVSYLLDNAARRLSGLKEPVVVAACPNKFDDIGYFPDWLGVQVGDAMWERTDYRGERGAVSETSRDPDDLVTAREVLRWLQDAEWRRQVELAFGLKLFNEALAVVRQHGAVWFVISASNDGEDIAFLVGSSGALQRVGVPSRLDQRLKRNRPLLLERIDPEAWPRLHAAVPAFPVDGLIQDKDAAAGAQLVELVQDTFAKLDEVRGSFVYVAAAACDPNHPMAGRDWRAIATDGFAVTKNSWAHQEMYKKMLARYGALAEGLNELVSTLEAAKWRDLFSRSVMPLPHDASLGLLVHGSKRWIIAAETAVFALMPGGGLGLVGACDVHNADRIVIHLFDGGEP
jgi:hypothetical protein